MRRDNHIIMALAVMGLAASTAQATAQARPAPSQIEELLQQQINQDRFQKQQERQKQLQRGVPLRRSSSQETPPRTPRARAAKEQPYSVLIIAGKRKALQADLIDENQEVIRVKVGDRLTTSSSQVFFVRAITDKSVQLVKDGRVFFAPMATEKNIKPRARSRSSNR